MQPFIKQAVIEFLYDKSFSTVLDAPAGDGWLAEALGGRTGVDGVDLYSNPKGYRKFWQHNLDEGLPADCGSYDLICCLEGLEHIGNPLLLLREFYSRLSPGGLLVVTTPNVWFPQARLQYLWRGFFPSFPCLIGKISPGTHMHITPWSWPQLYLFLKLAGFQHPEIVTGHFAKAKHLHERLFAIPGRIYCWHRARQAATEEELSFWQTAKSDASLLGRVLIVVAQKD